MKELAEFLQSERRKRGLTLQELSECSGVGPGTLQRFEAGEFEALGASLLIRHAIRGYCSALGMDPEPFLVEHASEIDRYNFQEEGIRRYARQVKALKIKRMVGPPLMLLALATAGVMYAGVWVSEKRAKLLEPPPAERILSQDEIPAELRQKLALLSKQAPLGAAREAAQRHDADLREAEQALRDAEKNIKEAEKAREIEQAAEAEKSEKARTETVADVAAVQNEPAPEAPSQKVALSNSMEVMAEDRYSETAEAPKGNTFYVEASAKTWVQVRIDDRVTRSAMLHPGDKREWTAQKGMQVIIGNAGGVRMTWDGTQIDAPRDPGRVLRFRLPDQILAVR